jgi:hypothetical protein
VKAKTGSKMRRIILFTLLIISGINGTAKEKQLTITNERVELIITEKTTIPQLKKLKKILKEKANIDFSFKDIIVDSRNHIRKITIGVDSNDGIKSTGTLMISNIYNVGFVRNYPLKSGSPTEKPLIIGNISEKEIKLD